MIGFALVIALALLLVWQVYLHRDQTGDIEEITATTLGFTPVEVTENTVLIFGMTSAVSETGDAK